jgi:hypothetical protein
MNTDDFAANSHDTGNWIRKELLDSLLMTDAHPWRNEVANVFRLQFDHRVTECGGGLLIGECDATRDIGHNHRYWGRVQDSGEMLVI